MMDHFLTQVDKKFGNLLLLDAERNISAKGEEKPEVFNVFFSLVFSIIFSLLIGIEGIIKSP